MSSSTTNNATINATTSQSPNQIQPECLSCRIIGSGTLGGVGVYALYQTRAAAPGSPLGKKMVGGVGVALLIASVIRWKQTAPQQALSS